LDDHLMLARIGVFLVLDQTDAVRIPQDDVERATEEVIA
jgi:hypothetical protein